MAEKLNEVQKYQLAVESCRKLTKPMRKRQLNILKEYSHGYYENTGEPVAKPLNMVFRGMSILVPLLASNNPKVMIRPRVLQLKPFAETMRLTMNHCIGEINLIRTLRSCVVNSLSYIGVTKCGIAEGGPEVEDAFGKFHDAGQFYCDVVDGADYVWDVAARTREQMDFEGNIYRVPMEWIRDSGLFKNYDKLEPTYKEYGESDKRPEDVAKENLTNFEVNEMRPYVEVIDLWVPYENKVITIPKDGQGTEVLRTVDHNGPEAGPYDLLYYHSFPESIVPIPPIWIWMDLHDYINTIARRMGRQAERERTVLAYEGVADEDAKAIQETADGESVRVDNIDRLKEIKFGGINEQSYPYMAWLKQNWSEMAGNADLLGGIKPQAETLGQEQMLQANATAGVEDMIWQVHNFTKSILEKMAWHIWTDPLIDITVSKRVAGVGNLDVKFTPEAREGDFLDYNIDVEPYSMQRMSPATRMNKIMQLVSGVIMPTIQMAAQQGDSLIVRNLVKSVAKDMDLTEAEVDSWYKSAVPQQPDTGPYQPLQGTTSGQSDDRFGASPASKAANMNQQQTRAGGQPSPAQK